MLSGLNSLGNPAKVVENKGDQIYVRKNYARGHSAGEAVKRTAEVTANGVNKVTATVDIPTLI